MESTRRSVKQPFYKQNWIIGLGVTILVAALSFLGVFHGLEWAAYEWLMQVSSDRASSEDVVIVEIDESSLEKLGSWPFSRQTLAKANRLIAQGRPRSIGYLVPFDYAENKYALETLNTLHRTHQKALGKNGAKVIKQAQRLLGTDKTLANSFKKAGNAVLAMPYRTVEGSAGELLMLPESLARFRLQSAPEQGTMHALKSFVRKWSSGAANELATVFTPPLDTFSRVAAAVGLGLDATVTQRAHAINSVPLAIRHGEDYLPSFALMLAAQTKKIRHQEILIYEGKGVQLGDDFIETDADLHVYPVFYQAQDNVPSVETISFADLLDEKVPAWTLQYKTVLVGLTVPRLVELVDTPMGEALPPVMVTAQIVASLLDGELYRKPAWTAWGQLLAFVLVAVYSMFLLPRLRLVTGLILTGLLILLVFNVQFVSLLTQSLWLPMMAPIVVLLTVSVLMAGQRLLLTREKALLDRIQSHREDLSESNLLLGQALQSQGRFDKAFAKYRACLPKEVVLDQLYHLGLDFEGKRQFSRASDVFRYIQAHNPDFKDTAERIERNNRRINALAFNARSGGGFDRTLILSGEGVQKPKLGRYRIDKELGQGEMGVVYLGHDPRIGRTVAIKTMTFTKEFDEEELPKIKKRFLREAEAAGRLNHPHIVTIYDVGEEQDLAYIAMDYLSGTAMSEYARPDNLLPLEEVFRVIIQVAAALESAHKQRVVHRDIKPANIIYDRDAGMATVTDFGVASLTDVSKTKSGMILGTPAFMSPEHLAGERIDGRSDIFSVGVTLYQLLIGRLPFEAETLPSLIYKITNEKHLDVRELRPEIPPCISQIIDRCLMKKPDDRFQKAGLVASSLMRCTQIIVASKISDPNFVGNPKLVN